MRVGEDKSVDVARVVRERNAISRDLVRTSLEHPAVDEHARHARVEKELRAGDRRRATQEGKLHARLFWPHMFGPVLRGDKVTLRPGREDDAPHFVRWFAI